MLLEDEQEINNKIKMNIYNVFCILLISIIYYNYLSQISRFCTMLINLYQFYLLKKLLKIISTYFLPKRINPIAIKPSGLNIKPIGVSLK